MRALRQLALGIFACALCWLAMIPVTHWLEWVIA